MQIRIFIQMVCGISFLLWVSSCAIDRSYESGLKNIQNQQWPEAIKSLEQAQKNKPKDFRIEIALERAQSGYASELAQKGSKLLEINDLQGARELFMSALACDRTNALAQDGLKTIENRFKAIGLLQEAEKCKSQNELHEALFKYREALKYDPNYPGISSTISELTTRLDSTANPKPSNLDRPVSFTFDNTSLADIFRAIGSAAEYNILADESQELQKIVTLDVRKISLKEAIDDLITTYQLLMIPLSENSCLITADTMENRNRFKKEEVKLFSLRNAEASALKKLIDPMLSPAIIIADERMNALVVRCDQEMMPVATRLISSMDSRDSEVLIEMELLEVNESSLKDLGTDLGEDPRVKVSLHGGLQQEGSGGSLTLNDLESISKSEVFLTVPSLYLRLLKQDAQTRILAQPRIRILNRQTANFHVGEKVPVKVTTSRYRNTTEETAVYEYRDIGILLELTPKILSGDELELALKAEISSILEQTDSGLPTIGAREIKSVLRLSHGETEIIAGLIKDEERKGTQKIPLLGDIPVLGRLFSSLSQDKRQADIVIAITPIILDRPSIESASDSLWKGNVPILETSRAGRPSPSIPRTAPEPLKPFASDPSGKDANLETTATGPSGTVNQDEDEPPDLSQASVYMEPSPARAGIDQKIKVTVMIEEAENVGSVPFYIEFDPSVIQVTGVEEGTFLSQDGKTTSFMSSVDNENGRIIVGLTRLGSVEGQSGSGSLMSFEFSGKSTGTTALRFTHQSVKDPRAKNLPAIFTDGSAEISG